jgi:predicted nucleic acid-binding protein
MIVVDSNIITARSLTSSLTPIAERLEQKDPVWVVPILWRYEFQNILATAIKAKQITFERAEEVWERVAGTLADNESEPSPLKVLDLVARFRITAYAGQLIALAMQMGVPCLTEDLPLREKFPGIAFSMHDFLNPPTARTIREKSGRYRGRKIRFKD